MPISAATDNAVAVRERAAFPHDTVAACSEPSVSFPTHRKEKIKIRVKRAARVKI